MTRTTRLRLGLATTMFAASLGLVAQAAEVTGAGSSFVYPVLSKWSAAYNAKTGNKVKAVSEFRRLSGASADKALDVIAIREKGLVKKGGGMEFF